MTNSKTGVEVYRTNGTIRGRLGHDDVYDFESETSPGTIIVRAEDGWAIIQDGLTVRIPAGIVDEMHELLSL